MKLRILCCLLFFHLTENKETFPRRTNVIITTDESSDFRRSLYFLLKKVVYGTSLSKHRLSLHTTTGLSQSLFEFQTRRCMLEKFKKQKHSHHYSLYTVLKSSTKEVLKRFKSERNILVVLTAKEKLTAREKHFLSHFHQISHNSEVFLVSYGKHAPRHVTKTRYITHVFGHSTTEIVKQLPFVQAANLHACTTRKHEHVDECARRCECVHGHLTNCKRVRKEFSSLTLHERKRYVDILLEVSTNPKYRFTWSKYAKIHHDYFLKGIHEEHQFFPWHRKYILGFENILRAIDCRMTIPVWNWAYFSRISWLRSPTYHMWDNEGGFGGNGVPSKGYCVTTGSYRLGKWESSPYEDKENVAILACQFNDTCFNISKESRALSNCLRRNFRCTLPSYHNVQSIINNHTAIMFKEFEAIVRSIWHNQIHNCVGGHMLTNFASNSPEFWSHHAIIDAMWDEWQRKGRAYARYNAYKGRHTTLLGYKPKEYRHEYVNINNLGGCGVKVMYEGIFASTRSHKQQKH